MPSEEGAVFEFVTLDGIPVAEYDGEFARITEAADETARLLGIPLAVRKKDTGSDS